MSPTALDAELRHEVAGRIIAFKCFYLVEIFTRRKKINGYEWIEILPLRDHILFVHQAAHKTQVEGHFAIEES